MFKYAVDLLLRMCSYCYGVYFRNILYPCLWAWI